MTETIPNYGKLPAKVDPTMLALMKGAFGKEGLPMPFTKEVFLIDTHVAGTSFRELDDVEPNLSNGDLLCFKRDPENEHDKLAIMIHDDKGNHLGFVPQAKNEILARLMDAGKLIFGKLENKEWCGNWLKLKIRVFMREI
ncbi:hypothetical protein BVX94_02380 [bacterium B17]|nr:hypothetical protein BVX94_02380 [bacterium B17]